MSVKFSTVDSILVLLQADRYTGESNRTAAANYKRSMRALKQLCLSPEDQNRILCALSFHKQDGTQHAWLAAELLPKGAEMTTEARPANGRSKEHKLKCWPEFFAALVAGTKTFEIRENDRDYQVGHKLTLAEFVPHETCNGSGRVWDNGDFSECQCMTSRNKKGYFTGRTVGRVVTYMTDFEQQDGFVVMGIK
jgi:hypothetical protein